MPAMIAASMPMPLMTRKWWVCGPSRPLGRRGRSASPSGSACRLWPRLRLVLGRSDAQLADVDAAVAPRQRDGEGSLERRPAGRGCARAGCRCPRAGCRAASRCRRARSRRCARCRRRRGCTRGRRPRAGRLRPGPAPVSSAVVSRKTGSPQPFARQAAVTRSRTGREVGELRRVDDDGRAPHRRIAAPPRSGSGPGGVAAVGGAGERSPPGRRGS